MIEVADQADPHIKNGNAVFMTSRNKVQFPLTIRTRKIGDRIKLKGMNGLKKVKDIFIDHKLLCGIGTNGRL